MCIAKFSNILSELGIQEWPNYVKFQDFFSLYSIQDLWVFIQGFFLLNFGGEGGV